MKRAYAFCLLAGWALVASAAPPVPAESPAVMTTPTATSTLTPTALAPTAMAPAAPAPAASAKPRAAGSKVTDHVELDQTTITGNRELPNVMVIVPWKESGPGEPGKPGTSLLDEALAPLDREEFRRELQYHQALHGKAPPASANPVPVSHPTSP